VVVLVSAPLVRVPLHMLERPVSGCRPSPLELAIVDDKQKLTNYHPTALYNVLNLIKFLENNIFLVDIFLILMFVVPLSRRLNGSSPASRGNQNTLRRDTLGDGRRIRISDPR